MCVHVLGFANCKPNSEKRKKVGGREEGREKEKEREREKKERKIYVCDLSLELTPPSPKTLFQVTTGDRPGEKWYEIYSVG